MSKKLTTFLIAAALPFGAQAATETWNFLTDGQLDGHFNGNTLTVANSNELRVTGWSDTAGHNDNKLADGRLVRYNSGYGFVNRDETSGQVPGHSIDNHDSADGTDTDMVLLSFQNSVTLKELSIGWACEGGGTTDSSNCQRSQSDVTILGYTGDSDSYNIPAHSTWESLEATGLWETVASIPDFDDFSTYQLAENTLSSKFWFIGAFNSVFSDSGSNIGLGWRDGFKLKGVGGYTTPGGGGEVPLPSSALLLIIGLLTMASLKRPANRANAFAA